VIYNSIDTIPSKIYFRVLETLEYSLLCSDAEKVPQEKLIEIFEKIRAEDEKLIGDKSKNKELDIYCKIEFLSAKYKKVKYIVFYLRHLKDQDLIDILIKDGYKFTDDFNASLDTIERLCESLLVKIEIVRNRLPKRKENEENETKEIPFEEVVLSYCALLGMGFVDTNTIVQSQYRAIVRMGNNKIEKLNKSQHNGGK
jgi:hypothetical protein